MSADLDDGPERGFAGRLKRRRAREDAGETLPAEGRFEFGYGGWNVTVAPMVPPEEPWLAGQDDPLPRRREEEARRPPVPDPAVEERLTPRRPERGRQSVTAASEPAAAVPPMPAAALPPLTAAPPPAEDRPLIVPTSPRRRTMPEAPSRLEGPRVPPRERADGDGGRQRRAQRILGGGTVMIDDELFPLIDWSIGGIAIRSEGHLYRIGDRRLLELEIDLDDYAVNLDLDGEVVNRSSDRTEWRFVSPTETQRQVLRALTQASAGNAAVVFPRGGQGGRGAGALSRKARARRRPSLVMALVSLLFNAVVILAAAGIVIAALNDGALPELDGFVAALPEAPPEPAAAPTGPIRAEHAAVAVERVALAAPAAGIVLEWATAPGGSVARGEPLVSLAVGEADEARSEAVLSPCDCTLARVLAVAGERVEAGGDLAFLYQAGVEAHVQALFAPGSTPNPGDPVSVTLTYTGEVRDGVVDRVGRPDEPSDFIGLPGTVFADNPADVFAVVRTEPGLPPALAGDPAEVMVRPLP